MSLWQCFGVSMDSQKSRDITIEDVKALVVYLAVIGFIIFVLIGLDSYGFDVGKTLENIIIIALVVGAIVVLSLIFEKPEKVAIVYPSDWDEIRKRIYYRDSYSCRNCGATDTMLHVHHIVPLSRGGTSIDSNLVTLV